LFDGDDLLNMKSRKPDAKNKSTGKTIRVLGFLMAAFSFENVKAVKRPRFIPPV